MSRSKQKAGYLGSQEYCFYVESARKAGFDIGKTPMNSGWRLLALHCGFGTISTLRNSTKQDALFYLKSKFGEYLAPVSRARKVRSPRVAREYSTTQKRSDSPSSNVGSSDFLQTYEWRKLRLVALKKYGTVCRCCGASPKTGAVMNVDHIKPRKIYPELALSLDNLQVLCAECNHGKGNWDMTDWREKETV